MGLKPSLISRFVGLKRLNLRLDDCFAAEWGKHVYINALALGAICAEKLLLFSKLPQRLEEVTVVITCGDVGWLPLGTGQDSQDDRSLSWTVVTRYSLTTQIRVAVLKRDPIDLPEWCLLPPCSFLNPPSK
jgi:hypothetical protein